MWAGFRLQRIEDDEGTVFFTAAGPDGGVEFLTNFAFDDASHYRGIPTAIALPGTSNKMAGISWLQTGPEEPLLVFAIKNCSHFLAPQLRQICATLRVRVVMLPGETAVIALCLST